MTDHVPVLPRSAMESPGSVIVKPGDPRWHELQKLGAERQCGECQVCCYATELRALNKPQMTRCEHQCANGCAIYATRPADCAGFLCGWKLGALTDRPDKSGLFWWNALGTDGGMTCRLDIDPTIATPPQVWLAFQHGSGITEAGVTIWIRVRGYRFSLIKTAYAAPDTLAFAVDKWPGETDSQAMKRAPKIQDRARNLWACLSSFAETGRACPESKLKLADALKLSNDPRMKQLVDLVRQEIERP